MIYLDNATGLKITDTGINPLAIEAPGLASIREYLDRMILSASGWRGVFASDGNQESESPVLSPEHMMITAAIGRSFADWFGSVSSDGSEIVVGTDTRPTGRSIADIIIAMLSASGYTVRYIFIASAPEIMAYAANDPDIGGFIYISASHNPIGHNGVKFGLGDGSVLEASASAELKSRFLDIFTPGRYDAFRAEVLEAAGLHGRGVEAVYANVEKHKNEALDAYLEFTNEVITGPVDEAEREAVLDSIRRSCESRPFGVVAELNGSARGASIDRECLRNLGIDAYFVNDTPGVIAHRIVPEGESLEPCCRILETRHAEARHFEIGYVPDNDGDRGNLVYYNRESRSAMPIHAQEVFALACVSELAYLASIEAHDSKKTAIVVNGPTSLRIERIAGYFGAEVFRVEVGEAHVVTRARQLRKQGYLVRILGEGSNGGTIIHPSSVRDPLSTIGAVIKMLRFTHGDRPSPLDMWLSRVAETGTPVPAPSKEFGIHELIGTLPVFTTTGAYEDRAILRIEIPDHGEFKRSYEARFPGEFDSKRDYLEERFGIVSWRAVNYEGLEAKPGIGNRDTSGAERGGLKILFSDEERIDRGFVWMRGSGTEPVFRVLADIQGDDPEGEAWLLEWQKQMISRAGS